MAGSLLDVDAARAQLLDGVVPLPAESVAIADAAGRVLAKPLAARLTQPPFAAAAMDGYAIRWADRPGPWRIVAESAAGHGWAGTLGPGEAARIFTGAPVPIGADTIMVQEDVTRDGDTAHLTGEGPPHAGAHIRKAGQDFAAGDTLLAAGTRLTPAQIGLLAAAGHGELPVVRCPRVTLISTGDELVPPGTQPGPDQIVSSNAVMLGALLAAAGAQIHDPGIIPDRRNALAEVLGAAKADLIITIGGASVGDHDLVVPVLRELGATLDFWKIAMRPGKPLLAGRLGETRVVGLPGNPVSSYVCSLLFIVPLLQRLGGHSEGLPLRRLPLAAPLPANGARRDHLRGRLTAAGEAQAFDRQDSALLALLAAADLLIIRLPHAPAAAAGEPVDCILLDTFAPVA